MEKGSFHDLHGSDSYVSTLGLKKADMEKAAAVDEEEIEHELLEKEAVIAKIASVKAQEARQIKEKPTANTRGKRNAAALFTYIRSMGNVWFPVFCAFTVGNIGFRSAQRERPFPLAFCPNLWTCRGADCII